MSTEVTTDRSRLVHLVSETDPETRALLGMLFLSASAHTDTFGGMEWRRRIREEGGWSSTVEWYGAAMLRAAKQLDEEWVRNFVREIRP